MIKDFAGEFNRYKIIGEKALDQLSEDSLNKVFGLDNNSIAVIVRHISGNLVSRFTDFLSSDGEKPWRDRDSEFENRIYTREQTYELWNKGWGVLNDELAKVNDTDLQKEVKIRDQSLTVHAALSRSVAHVAYHVGQIVTLARIQKEEHWGWITIPRGKSQEFNQKMTKGLYQEPGRS